MFGWQKINHKIFAVLSVFLILITFFAATIWSYVSYKGEYSYIYERNLVYLIDNTFAVIDNIQNHVKHGIISENDAKTHVKEYFRTFYYGDDGYFWIIDTSGFLIMHAAMEEIDNSQIMDTGIPLYDSVAEAFLKSAREYPDGAFVEYMWPKPKQDHAVRKKAYVRLIPEWNWIIGTGFYIDDVEQEVYHDLKWSAFIMLGISLALTLITCVIIFSSLSNPKK